MKRLSRLLSFVLCILMVLPFAACGAMGDDVAEIAPEPVMDVADLDKLAAVEQEFPGKTAEESAEIWAWAHQVVAEWNERYQALLVEVEAEQKAKGFQKDDSEYSRTILVGRNYQDVLNQKQTNRNKWRATRTLSSLKGWTESKWSKTVFERTEYGGFIDESAKQEATGFFYTKKIDGRWFLIDPLGYPCILSSIQDVSPVYADNPTQKEWVQSEFGSDEKWAIATTVKLKEDHGVYGTTGLDGRLKNYLDVVPEGFVNCSAAGPTITTYCRNVLGIAWDAGSTYFDPNISELSKQGDAGKAQCNMVMPVFDRGFIEYLDEAGKTMLAPYANDSRIVAWNCGNETPIKPDMLDRYLKYTDPDYMATAYPNNPKTQHYYETYAVTMTWMRFMTGKETFGPKDVTDELRQLFLGFIYDHLLYVSRQAYKKYVPNHLFAGIRWLSNGEVIIDGDDESNTIMSRPWLARFVSRHSDVVTLNWYRSYYSGSEIYENFTMWTGGKPFMLTEFNGWTEDNTTYLGRTDFDRGGCFATQEERAAYYEHVTLEWMEWDTLVGWSWYRYNHYLSFGVPSSICGIVDDNGQYDLYMQESMGRIGHVAYNLARFLHERHE